MYFIIIFKNIMYLCLTIMCPMFVFREINYDIVISLLSCHYLVKKFIS